jgi:hypothetical protein
MVWTGSIWLRIGTMEGSCEYGDALSGSLKCWKFLSSCTIGSFSQEGLSSLSK